jgi:hypothetical protein
MTRIEVNLSSEYGIMFVYDPKSAVTIPPEAGVEAVMSTPTCVAFSVLSYVDGDAKVVLCESPDDARCIEYFSGKLACPSNSLSLFDHNGFAFASVPLKDGYADVSIRMSEKTNPDVVECVISNIASF